jgi:hypothetical protein
MPNPPDEKSEKAILERTITFTTIRSLKDAMNDNEKQHCGLTKLEDQQWINLDNWLSNNAVLAPVGGGKGGN